MPSAAAVDLRAASNLSSAFDDADDTFEEDAPEDGDKVFTHRSAYFSAGGAYDYFADPDLGVEFASAPAPGVVIREHEMRGRRGAEILEIEGASPLRARSKSRSKSHSRSRTRSPRSSPPPPRPAPASRRTPRRRPWAGVTHRSRRRRRRRVEQQPERPRAQPLEPREPAREFKPRVRRRARDADAGELARGAHPRAGIHPSPRPRDPSPARPQV
ncbi:hypothetical protein FB451DRAFT_1256624 [Mycena latifolia]|nr:hypothetical protein FB451DRAFT_1256624 [Mycena latifolia]